MKRRLDRLAWMLALFVAASATPAYSQGPTTGSITGTVTDEASAVLPGVTVTVTGAAEISVAPTVTSAKGEYRFPSLAPGDYQLTFELAGFATLVREDIEVNIDFTTTVDAQLKLASVSETVVVRGESPLVDVENTTLQDIIKAEVLENRPNSRDVYAIIGAMPGVRMSSFDIGGANIGNPTDFVVYGREGNDRINMQGVNRSEGSGGSPGYLDYGSFEQVTIGTAANDASVPTPGIIFNAVLKSGGDTFSGTEFFAYQNKDLQSENNTEKYRRFGIGSGTRILHMYDPNFDLGGPIVRKRAWFYTSARFQSVDTKFNTFPFENPGSLGNLRELKHVTAKSTIQAGSTGKVEPFFTLSSKYQPYRDADGDGTSDTAQNQLSYTWTGGVTWTRVHSNTWLTELTTGTWGYNWHRRARGLNGEVNENLAHRRFDDTEDHIRGAISRSRLKRGRFQFGGKVTKYLDGWLGVNQNLTIGQLSEWETGDLSSYGFKDSFQMQFQSPVGADFTVPWRVIIYNTPYEEVNSYWHHSAYLQDRIRVNPRLTVNAGLRFDYYSQYYPDQQIGQGPWTDFFYRGSALSNGFSLPVAPFAADLRVPGAQVYDYGKLAPRVGVAYVLDRAGSSRSVLKFNWGRFYFNEGSGEADDLNLAGARNVTFTWLDANGDRLFQVNELGDFVEISGAGNVRLAPDLEVAYMDETNVWLERQLGRDLAARVGYIRRISNNRWADVNLTRTRELWTRLREGYDTGIDGVRDTDDDGGPFVYHDYPAAADLPTCPPTRTFELTPRVTGGCFPASFFERRAIPTNDGIRNSMDMTLTKRTSDRWYGQVSYVSTWDNNLSTGFPQTPNQDRFNEWTQRIWQFKVDATYYAPWGLIVSPSLRMQNGSNLGRNINVTTRTGTLSFRLEPFAAYREDTTTVWDLAVFKTLRLGRQRNLRLSVDTYNLFNSNVPLTRDSQTGRSTVTYQPTGERLNVQRFYRPTAIMPPRVVRFAVRYTFGGVRGRRGQPSSVAADSEK